MRAALSSLVLFAAIAGLVASADLPTAAALQKEKDKKPDDKKADDKKADSKAEVGSVEVFKAKDGWRYKIIGANGKAIAGNYVGHDKKEDALKEIEALKATLAKGKVEVKDAKDDKK